MDFYSLSLFIGGFVATLLAFIIRNDIDLESVIFWIAYIIMLSGLGKCIFVLCLFIQKTLLLKDWVADFLIFIPLFLLSLVLSLWLLIWIGGRILIFINDAN